MLTDKTAGRLSFWGLFVGLLYFLGVATLGEIVIARGLYIAAVSAVIVGIARLFVEWRHARVK